MEGLVTSFVKGLAARNCNGRGLIDYLKGKI